MNGAWEGPAAFELFHHALAPVASLPILEVISGVHFQSDLRWDWGPLSTIISPSNTDPIRSTSSTTLVVATDVIVSSDASKAGAPAAFSIAFAQ